MTNPAMLLQVHIDGCVKSLQNGGKIMICGNGGSAAEAQHFAAELMVRFKKDRPPLAALALTTDTSFLTACSNDLGFEFVFARQIQALGRPGDVLIALSTSMRSRNIIAAIEAAQRRDMRLLLPPNPHLLSVAGRQEKHLEWLHYLAEGIEEKMFP